MKKIMNMGKGIGTAMLLIDTMSDEVVLGGNDLAEWMELLPGA